MVVVEVGEEGGQVGVAERPDRHARRLVVTGGPEAVRVGVGVGPGHGGLLVVLAGGPLRARPALGAARSVRVGALVLLAAVDGCWAGRVAALLAVWSVRWRPWTRCDGLAGVVPGGPLGGLARHRAEGLVGVGDLVGAAVVLDGGGGLPPGPPPSGALGDRAEFAAQVAGLLVLDGQAAGAALPGQLADDLAVGGAEVGVGLQPAGPALLMLAQRRARCRRPGRPAGGPPPAAARSVAAGPAGQRRRSIPRPWRWWSCVVVSCSRAWSACGSAGAGPRQLPGPVPGGLVEQAPGAGRVRPAVPRVDSRRRSRLLGVSIAKVWSPARDRAWASWS